MWPWSKTKERPKPLEEVRSEQLDRESKQACMQFKAALEELEGMLTVESRPNKSRNGQD